LQKYPEEFTYTPKAAKILNYKELCYRGYNVDVEVREKHGLKNAYQYIDKLYKALYNKTRKRE
jgi:hypothetical protein